MNYQCDLCGSRNYRIAYKVNSRLIARCSECGLVSYYPLPEPCELPHFYNDEEYLNNSYFSRKSNAIKTAHNRYFLEIVDLARKHCGGSGKLLEIGAGKGDFLRLCLERGIRVEGIEISSRRAEALKTELDCNIYNGIVEEIDFPPESYAMVVGFDVLEHCLSPMRFLQKVQRILKPGGVLALSTISIANILYALGDSFYRLKIRQPVQRLYPPYHLYYFAPHTLREYLFANGFSIVEMKQENYDYRIASNSLLMQQALRCIYVWQDITGGKTNLHMVAIKKANSDGT